MARLQAAASASPAPLHQPVTSRQEPALNPLLDAALRYARNWRVFPAGANKQPLTKAGFKDATQNEDTIREWWTKWPDASIALDLPEDIAVVDIDPRNGGARDAYDFPNTREVTTQSGGWHLYYRVPVDVRVRKELAPGIDVKRGGTGYVLAPPSAGYELVRDVRIADLPAELLALIRKDAPAPRDADGFEFGVGTPYGRSALEREVGKLVTAREGTRNEQLNRSAFAIGQLVAGGELHEAAAVEQVMDAATRAGLDPDEIDVTLKSGFQAGLAEPRRAPERERPEPSTSANPGAGPFRAVDPDSIRPPRKMLQEPFLYESALTWLWGPSGHGKSLALDKAIAELSRREVAACLWDWEDTSMEVERLARLGADFDYARVFIPREGDDVYDFASEGFIERVIETVAACDAKLVVFNPFFLLVPPASTDSADAWNTPVKKVVSSCTRIIQETGAAVVVTDHQESMDAEHAHGGRSKKALSDLYIVVRRAAGDYVPGLPYEFTLRNLKQSREYLPPVVGTVTGEHRGGHLRVEWGSYAAPEPFVAAIPDVEKTRLQRFKEMRRG